MVDCMWCLYCILTCIWLFFDWPTSIKPFSNMDFVPSKHESFMVVQPFWGDYSSASNSYENKFMISNLDLTLNPTLNPKTQVHSSPRTFSKIQPWAMLITYMYSVYDLYCVGLELLCNGPYFLIWNYTHRTLVHFRSLCQRFWTHLTMRSIYIRVKEPWSWTLSSSSWSILKMMSGW